MGAAERQLLAGAGEGLLPPRRRRIRPGLSSRSRAGRTLQVGGTGLDERGMQRGQQQYLYLRPEAVPQLGYQRRQVRAGRRKQTSLIGWARTRALGRATLWRRRREGPYWPARPVAGPVFPLHRDSYSPWQGRVLRRVREAVTSPTAVKCHSAVLPAIAVGVQDRKAAGSTLTVCTVAAPRCTVPLAAAAWPRPRAFRLPPQPVPPPWWRERGSGRRGGPAEPAAGAASLCVLGPPPYDRPATWSITDEAAPLRVTPLRAGGQLLCGRRHRRRGVPVTGRCDGYCGRGECRRGARGRQHY